MTESISRLQLGKIRRAHLTITHSRVSACRHKFVSYRAPALNCPDCWYAYFKTSVDLEALHDTLRRLGPEEVIAQKGVKYLKNSKRFLREELSPVEGEPIGIPE